MRRNDNYDHMIPFGLLLGLSEDPPCFVHSGIHSFPHSFTPTLLGVCAVYFYQRSPRGRDFR